MQKEFLGNVFNMFALLDPHGDFKIHPKWCEDCTPALTRKQKDERDKKLHDTKKDSLRLDNPSLTTDTETLVRGATLNLADINTLNTTINPTVRNQTVRGATLNLADIDTLNTTINPTLNSTVRNQTLNPDKETLNKTARTTLYSRNDKNKKKHRRRRKKDKKDKKRKDEAGLEDFADNGGETDLESNFDSTFESVVESTN